MDAWSEPIFVLFADDATSVALDDDRTRTAPIAGYPRLSHATQERSLACDLRPGGIHWETIDDDLPVKDVSAGRGSMTRSLLKAA